MRYAAVFAFLACWGCAVRQPASWRLVKRDTAEVLIPPDVTKKDLARRTFKADIAGDGRCAAATGVIDIVVTKRPRGNTARVTVTAGKLNEQPSEWLRSWASQLEERHCLAPGQGLKLAEKIAESVPLDPAGAFHLLYRDDRKTGEVDIDEQIRLQVVSPLWREPGVGMIDGPLLSVEGNDSHLTVTAKASDNLLGYERTLYSVQPKAAKAGYTIQPLYADRTIQSSTGATTERRPEPAINYFKFPADAAFYRLFYESTETDFAALVVAADTIAELDQRTKKLEASGGFASCKILNNDLCNAIPKDVAVNPVIAVTANGAELLVPRGATVGNLIRLPREQQATVLGHLTISRPWNGRLVPITFDRTDPGILRVILKGGEVISW
jgi:hypothetical protein